MIAESELPCSEEGIVLKRLFGGYGRTGGSVWTFIMTGADVSLSPVHLLQTLSGEVRVAGCFFPLSGGGSLLGGRGLEDEPFWLPHEI